MAIMNRVKSEYNLWHKMTKKLDETWLMYLVVYVSII